MLKKKDIDLARKENVLAEDHVFPTDKHVAPFDEAVILVDNKVIPDDEVCRTEIKADVQRGRIRLIYIPGVALATHAIKQCLIVGIQFYFFH